MIVQNSINSIINIDTFQSFYVSQIFAITFIHELIINHLFVDYFPSLSQFIRLCLSVLNYFFVCICLLVRMFVCTSAALLPYFEHIHYLFTFHRR